MDEDNKLAPQAESEYSQGIQAGQDLRTREPELKLGTISRSLPGTYIVTATVQGAKASEVKCIYAPGMMSQLMGVKDCSLPTEGTRVVLLALPNAPDTYIALCSLPEEFKGFKDLDKLDWVSMFGCSPEPGINAWDLACCTKESGDKDKVTHVPTYNDRPGTVLPGEYAIGNPMGVFLSLCHFIATLKATERAKLECFVFDDLVRLTSGQFQHWNAFGDTHIFNDAGGTNIEISGSHSAAEVRGYNSNSEIVDTSGDPSSMEERHRPKNPQAVMKKRFRLFMGALGDMLQVYLVNMQNGKSPETHEDPETRGASFKLHLANSGALNIASAAGMGFTLNDKIAAPSRIKEPWDPEGDTPETSKEPQAKKKLHFDFDDQEVSKYPWMHNIRAMSAEPWEDALGYQRFDEMSKDFRVPEAQDLDNLPGKYDELESDSRQDNYKGRKAGIRVEQDGSVRLWDNWGSEIYMRGGDIVLACPGNIIMQPGKSVVAIAKDVVLKAKKSVDITATEKDVRIAAGKNIYGYADKGGMLFEANGSSEPGYPDGLQGEDVPGGGIVFKAKNSSINMWSKNITMLADNFRFKIAHSLAMSAKYLYGVFTSSIMLETSGKAGFAASPGSAEIFGGSANVIGSSSANVIKGSKVMVPLTWADAQGNPYETVSAMAESVHKEFNKEGQWLGALAPDLRESMKFTFRTPQQYGTLRGTEVHMAADQASIYMPRWQVLVKNNYKYISGGYNNSWPETEVNGTFAWPGAGVRDTALVTVADVPNVDLKTMDAQGRKAMSNKAGSIARTTLNEYITMK